MFYQRHIYIRVLAQVHVLQGTTSCAAGMVTTAGINHAMCLKKYGLTRKLAGK